MVESCNICQHTSGQELWASTKFITLIKTKQLIKPKYFDVTDMSNPRTLINSFKSITKKINFIFIFVSFENSISKYCSFMSNKINTKKMAIICFSRNKSNPKREYENGIKASTSFFFFLYCGTI